MKKLLIVGLILVFVPCVTAWAADPDVGCGVGTQVTVGELLTSLDQVMARDEVFSAYLGS